MQVAIVELRGKYETQNSADYRHGRDYQRHHRADSAQRLSVCVATHRPQQLKSSLLPSAYKKADLGKSVAGKAIRFCR